MNSSKRGSARTSVGIPMMGSIQTPDRQTDAYIPINAARGTWEQDMAAKIDNAFEKKLKWGGGGSFPLNPGEG